MKKTSILIASCVLGFSCLIAQPKPKTPAAPSSTPASTSNDNTQTIALQQAIYKNAIKYADPGMAKSALYTLLELDKENTTFKYKDSLLNLYYGSQAYISAVLLGRELHAESPQNQTTLAILALSEQNLGLAVEALEHYKKLYTLSRNPSDLYQAGVIEFKLQRFLECNQSLDAVMNDPNSEKEKLYISYDQRQGQDVPLRAAVYNIKGYVAASTGKKEEAVKFYQQALALAPEFQLAKNNLELLVNPPKDAPKK